MKKIIRLTAIIMTLTTQSLSLAACGGAKTGEAVVFTAQEFNRDISDYGTDWIYAANQTLTVFPDNTYMLAVTVSGVRYQDIAGRGDQTTVYYGKCTSAVSAELGEGYTDYTLEKATRVTYHQHMQMGMYFGGEYILDSTAKEWSDELAEASGYADAAAFLADKAVGFTVTVDPATGLISTIQ